MDYQESREAWKQRVEPLMEQDLVRKDNEDLQVHLKRLFELKSDTHTLLPKMLVAICEVFELKQPSEEDMKKSSYIELKDFVYNTLSIGDIPAGDFAVDLKEV